MSNVRSLQPLTPEKQAIVVKWRPLALKYAMQALQRRGLQHYMEDAEGVAHIALVRAVNVWRPEKPFPPCLRVWVARMAKIFNAHDARTVHQSERSASHVDALSINAPIKYRGNTIDDYAYQDALVDHSIGDPAEPIDSMRLMRAVETVLPSLVTGGRRGKEASRNARLSVKLWARRTLEDVPYEELGRPYKLSRQAVQQRVARVQAAFEEWARPIREEAA